MKIDKNGKWHRSGGPAVEYADGEKGWYRHGQLHREDGPAIEWPNGDVEYWIDYVELTEVEYFVRYGVAND